MTSASPQTAQPTRATANRVARIAFSAILIVVGAVSVFVAFNVAFGGIRTLGWQGTADFLSVTDLEAFAIRDNHARFFGGLFFAFGGFLVVGAFFVDRFRQALLYSFVLMFAGGVARFTALEPGVMFGPSILVSSLVELVLMPVLFVWLWRRRPTARVLASQ